ncbi:MAG: electron transport complex subunit E, partial [Gammaproteobacteria bacterium]|nr:electron transport complex subunit E [Gammaproteobacteria bacterium]
MTFQEIKDIFYNAVWKQNPGIVQLLGLCPLLAVSSTVVNGVSLGLATTLVMTVSSGTIAPIRNYIPNEIRIPVFILIIAVLVTVVQYLMNAYMYGLFIVLGIFIPLIVTNCIVLARVEAFASRNAALPSALDGMAMGLGLTAVLGVLGAMREVIGKGTLFSGIDLALGDGAKSWVLHVIPDYHGFLIAILPPGAFIGLGLLIAA